MYWPPEMTTIHLERATLIQNEKEHCHWRQKGLLGNVQNVMFVCTDRNRECLINEMPIINSVRGKQKIGSLKYLFHMR